MIQPSMSHQWKSVKRQWAIDGTPMNTNEDNGTQRQSLNTMDNRWTAIINHFCKIDGNRCNINEHTMGIVETQLNTHGARMGHQWNADGNQGRIYISIYIYGHTYICTYEYICTPMNNQWGSWNDRCTTNENQWRDVWTLCNTMKRWWKSVSIIDTFMGTM